jgi:hypothetical protein
VPKTKGRQGYAAIRNDTDVGLKHQKIGALIPVVEHLRHGLDSSPEYFGLSGSLDEAQDELVLDILDSPTEALTRVSLLFQVTMRATPGNHEMSMASYKPWAKPEPVKVREIELTRGLVALVDEQDYATLIEHNWSASLHMSPVAHRRINGDGRSYTTQTMHDFLMSPPEGVRVEHINGDTLDNRRENLRVVSLGRGVV